MTVFADLILIFFIFYILYKIIFKLIKLRFSSSNHTNNNAAQRFDTNNKDISDADFKDIK